MSHECPPIESVIADIEKYDLSVILIDEEEEGPRFAYSIGLYHNFKHPEIIVFGLKHDFNHRLIRRQPLLEHWPEEKTTTSPIWRPAGAPGVSALAQSGIERPKLLKKNLE